MAQRRMFSKTITNSSAFLTMPHSCQALYFQIGMNADDDGYCEHVMVMRMGAFQPDDLKILQAKGFVHVFDDMVLIIKDWNENNYIKKDRYTPSKYRETHKIEYVDTKCIQDVSKLETQDRIGKGSKGNKESAFSSFFEELWNEYPSKIGMKSAKKHFIASVKSEDDLSNIRIALKNYKKSKRVSKGIIQNGSTWFNNWQDWVEMPDNEVICVKCGGKGRYTVHGTNSSSEIVCECLK